MGSAHLHFLLFCALGGLGAAFALLIEDAGHGEQQQELQGQQQQEQQGQEQQGQQGQGQQAAPHRQLDGGVPWSARLDASMLRSASDEVCVLASPLSSDPHTPTLTP